MGNSLPVYTIIFFFLIMWNGSPIILQASPYHWTVSWPSEKIDCKLLKAVPGKWLAIQFSPRSYKRLDGIGDDISDIIKKNNDILLWLGTYFLHNFDTTSCNTASCCSDKEEKLKSERKTAAHATKKSWIKWKAFLFATRVHISPFLPRKGYHIFSDAIYLFGVWLCNTHLISWDPQSGELPLGTS